MKIEVKMGEKKRKKRAIRKRKFAKFGENFTILEEEIRVY